jgi:hypothetical protein
MPITVKHSKVSTIPDDADTSLVRPSDWNADHTLVGLGTMAEQNANNVNITGGSITGVSGLGTVTNVTGTSPVNVATGTTTPVISMPAATTSVDGYLTSTDWNTFNGKGVGTVTSVAATVPSVLSITGSPITTSGTLAIAYSGTALPVANGGTGATTAAEAFSDLTPLTLTTASATPLVLTNTSGYQQQIIGGTNQTITLPSTATLAVGWSFLITNGTGFTVTVNTSTGANVYANSNIGSYRVWCVSTANNNAASWSSGAETFSFETGSGSVVRATTPTLASPTFTSPSATGTLGFTGSNTAASNFHTTQTGGILTMGGTSGTGTIILGRSTVSQQTDIQAGTTASGSTKAMNIGTSGLAGSTTNIAIGSAVSGATSRTTLNGIVIDSISAAVSAAGTTQGTATALVSNINNVTVVTAAAAGVILPTAVAGMRILIRNSDSLDTLSIYPATGGQINALGANAASTLAAGLTTELVATTSTQWYTF